LRNVLLSTVEVSRVITEISIPVSARRDEVEE
jgi:hypothetical protein